MSNTIHIAQGDLTEAYVPFTLVGGDVPALASKSETILDANAAVLQYTVLGRISASGKLQICDLAAEDGSEVPVGVLAYAVGSAAANADAVAPVYFSGNFNIDALVWHASFSTDALKLAAFNDNKTIVMTNPRYST
ncbi:MAG: head decoration protein [Pseudomonadota bacterium]